MLFRAILCGGVWNGFLLGKAKKEDVPCRFCGRRDGDGHLFWDCTFPPPLSLPIQHVRDLPEFAFLMSLDRSNWPWCLLWHGWLPGLNGISAKDPWTTSFGDLASFHLERCLGAYPVDFAGAWTPIGMLLTLPWKCPEHPNVWTDGSREDCSSTGVYLPASELAFDGLIWGTAEEYGDARLERCRALMPVPGPLQTVQRAEFFGAILALQAYWPCHLGIDNLNVVWSIGRLLDRWCLTKPLPLVKDGDLVAIAQYMIQARGQDTVRVTQVKGHATDADVEQGRVGLEDKLGNAVADTAADLGRLHQPELVMDVWRASLNARDLWYPIMQQLHGFMIAVFGVVVNHEGRGDSAPDPLVWDQGSKRKQRKTDIRVNVDLASLLGHLAFKNGPWVQVHGGSMTGANVAAWPYSVSIL